ncbi:MAG TPA: thioester reductase domain-containing protein [Vicinamibacterales bacterium]|jgi:thioester reductase-like protein|nr:thioester reductase domain-containing protein [Vicinamibacterales bacterium]HEX2462070.1 thioester reductase domain-containing protein [Vicinamibacterales bacterium]
MSSLLARLEQVTAKHPDKRLYTFLDLNGRELESYTYQAFLRRVDLVAGHLQRDRRLAAGDRVLLAYPPGLEMICALVACTRAGLIPVPVFPPSSHEFRSAFYKMVRIARDCQGAAVLTTREYLLSLHVNLARSGRPTSLDNLDLAALPWIVTEEFTQPAGTPRVGRSSDVLFLQYTSGSTNHPKGVMVTHANVLHNCSLVADHPDPVAVSWLPQYHDMGLIGYYLYAALSGGTTYGFAPMHFIQRPALWFETITRFRATITSAPNFAFEYCMKPGRISEQTLAQTDLRSLKVLMAAAEPVDAGTYSRFLHRFQPYGLGRHSFVVAYGLAEHTLAVSSYGRTALSVSRDALARGCARVVTAASEITSARQIMSCGPPLGDTRVRIVDPDTHTVVEDGQVGEVWVHGRSKCRGYWDSPELTRDTFHAHVVGESQEGEGYLRTGDLGFTHRGELFVCGRMKDLIIVRGVNCYAHDVEHVVEHASPLIRRGGVVAFEIEQQTATGLAVVAEVRRRSALPDLYDIAVAVKHQLNVAIGAIALVPPNSLPKTTSGKAMRQRTKQLWRRGRFDVLGELAAADEARACSDTTALATIDTLKTRYQLTGTETCSLLDSGMDSLDLVRFMHELQELLNRKGENLLARALDTQLLQHITVADVFRVAELTETAPEVTTQYLADVVARLRDEQRRREHDTMVLDASLARALPPAPRRRRAPSDGVLLTGATGFLGPYLLKSLLEQSDAAIYALIRAPNEVHGAERLFTAFTSSLGAEAQSLAAEFTRRVKPVCGDLSHENLGLTSRAWQALSQSVGTIFHNAAAVNYLFTYQKLRPANVLGTAELVRLACEHGPTVFNHVSTTFIFGWAVKEVLYEADTNAGMELLDFGYSQSKWVSERLVVEAAGRGLPTRIFRPALVTPSITGGGNSFDIAIRLLAFMVNHGIGVAAHNQVSFVPVDVAANNMVAIAQMPDTANATFHVTSDDYANMMDVTSAITALTGRTFELFPLRAFVPEVVARCTPDDLLFPLLDFLIGSIDSISSMEFKRYDSAAYRRARDRSPHRRADPPLMETVSGILRFMQRTGIASLPSPHAGSLWTDTVKATIVGMKS